MRRLRDDRGQTIVFVAFFMIVLFAICALVIDLGSWFQAQRNTQAGADAAALAGAQLLPNTGTAASTATSYASTNVSGLNSWSPTFPDTNTIDVRLSKPVGEFFAHVLGVHTVTVSAHARAQVGTPGSIKGAVPIVVTESQVCGSASTGCFNVQKDLNFDSDSVTASKFGLVDLAGSSSSGSRSCTSSSSASTLGSWIRTGNPALLGINRWYCVATAGEVDRLETDLTVSIGKPLLVPVYNNVDPTGGTGKGSFFVIGWAAFVIDQVVNWHPNNKSCQPTCKVLRGRFVEYIVHDVVSTPGIPGFGVKVISLVQ